jgi:hypothetical protein
LGFGGLDVKERKGIVPVLRKERENTEFFVHLTKGWKPFTTLGCGLGEILGKIRYWSLISRKANRYNVSGIEIKRLTQYTRFDIP